MSVIDSIKKRIMRAYKRNILVLLGRYCLFYTFPRLFKYEVQLETTNICNARCVFCPNTRMRRKKQVMTQEVFTSILRVIKEERIPVKRFILHLNGEPLTDKNLIDRIRTIQQEFPSVAIMLAPSLHDL